MFGPSSVLVREYRFAYKAGVGTGRTVLRNIRECAADDTCKPRTTFDWHGDKPGFERIATPIKVPQSQLVAPMMLDVTGDGLDDLVVPTVPWNAATHSESPTTDWTITPNLGAAKTMGTGFFQVPVVAYSEDHNDSSNDPVLQQQPDLKVQPDRPLSAASSGAFGVASVVVDCEGVEVSRCEPLRARSSDAFVPGLDRNGGLLSACGASLATVSGAAG